MKKKKFAAQLALVMISILLLVPCLSGCAIEKYASPIDAKEGDWVDPVAYWELDDVDDDYFGVTMDRRMKGSSLQPVAFELKAIEYHPHYDVNLKDGGHVDNMTVSSDPWIVALGKSAADLTLTYSESGSSGFGASGSSTYDYSCELTIQNFQLVPLSRAKNETAFLYYQTYDATGSERSSEKTSDEHYGTDTVDYTGTISKHIVTTDEDAFPLDYDNGILETFLYFGVDGSLDKYIFDPQTQGRKNETEDYNGDLKVSFQVTRVMLGDKNTPIPEGLVSDQGSGEIEIDTNASDASGEEGYTVLAMIVTGLVAAGAAIAASGAAAGAGTGNSGEALEDETPKSTYKMYISKDFGNKIRYNRQGVQVNARMAEITPEGTEVDRPDLTQRISITSGGNVDVEGGGFTGGYMCALVSCSGVSGADNPNEGVVTFTFTGEGGSFTNNVLFELVGEARIDVKDELTMIYGDGKQYDVKIELVDFLTPAENITFNYGTAPVSAEAEKLDDAHYILHIRNNSQKSKETFFTTDSLRFEVAAENGKELASEGIVGTLVPEGLSVKRRNDTVIKDQRFALKCYENTDESGETDIPITRISFIVAIPQTDENGAATVKCPVITEGMFTFAPMTAPDERFANIANNAECVFNMEKYASSSDSIVTFEIQPKRQIPQEANIKYDITLPVSCECEGNTYTLDVPVRAIGDSLLSEMQAKEKELALLKKRLTRYLDRDEIAEFLASYDQKVSNMSAYDIRLMSMHLVHMAQYEAYEARWQGMKGDMLDWGLWGLEWVKWTGDQAFSLLIAKCTGPYAVLADSILSPAKDIVCDELGEAMVQYLDGSDVTMFNSESQKYEEMGVSMIENLVTNQIDSGTNPKKAGALLVCFLITKFCRNMAYGKNDDGTKMGAYEAIVASFGDLSVQAFKFAGGAKFQEFLSNPKNSGKIGQYVFEWLSKNMPVGVDGLESDAVVQKYLEEMVAIIGGKVKTAAPTTAAALEAGVICVPFKLTTGANDNLCDLTVTIDVMGNLDKLTDWLFNTIYSAFTFPTDVARLPDDATYFPKA